MSHSLAWPLSATACLCAVLGLVACSSEPISLDRHLGQSLQQAQAQQAVYPPGHWPQTTPPTDGMAAVNAVERYQQSFAKPLPPVNVMNIGVGTPMVAGAAAR